MGAQYHNTHPVSCHGTPIWWSQRGYPPHIHPLRGYIQGVSTPSGTHLLVCHLVPVPLHLLHMSCSHGCRAVHLYPRCTAPTTCSCTIHYWCAPRTTCMVCIHPIRGPNRGCIPPYPGGSGPPGTSSASAYPGIPPVCAPFWGGTGVPSAETPRVCMHTQHTRCVLCMHIPLYAHLWAHGDAPHY